LFCSQSILKWQPQLKGEILKARAAPKYENSFGWFERRTGRHDNTESLSTGFSVVLKNKGPPVVYYMRILFCLYSTRLASTAECVLDSYNRESDLKITPLWLQLPLIFKYTHYTERC
jgi:hypothetical protein